METTKKKNYHHGDLRQGLLNEAAHIIRQEGEEALSMRKLAGNMDVSRTAAYHHFDGKHALLCAIAEEGFKRLKEMTNKSLCEADDAVSEQSLARFSKNYVKFAVNNAEYYNLMFGNHIWKSPKITETLTKEAHSTFKIYVEKIRGWKKQGSISNHIEPTRFAQFSWSTLHGASRLIIDGIYIHTKSIDSICTNAASIFWQEIKPEK